MQQRREQLLEELRRAEQARDLLRELEHNLSEEKGPEFARRVRQLEQLAQSLPEAHIVRLVIESACFPASFLALLPRAAPATAPIAAPVPASPAMAPTAAPPAAPRAAPRTPAPAVAESA